MNLISTQFQLSFEVYYIFVANNWKKVISLASVRISHTSLGTPIINPERSLVAKVTKINVFIFGICDFYAALAYSISASPSALT